MELIKIIDKLNLDAAKKPGETRLAPSEKLDLLKKGLKIARTSFEIDDLRKRVVALKKAHPSLDESHHKEHAPKKKGAKH